MQKKREGHANEDVPLAFLGVSVPAGSYTPYVSSP